MAEQLFERKGCLKFKADFFPLPFFINEFTEFLFVFSKVELCGVILDSVGAC